ncbi:cop9 signalosome complex subunit [Podochytrium sp. JEL0797]|nr:cop9 signalosome complex subunit [Podochytrium sp. JEL0797]
MGHQDLGDHFYACGDLANAFTCYSRTRDYCSTTKHVLDMCFNIIKVSVDQKNFSHVQSYVIKAESTPDPSAAPLSATTPTAVVSPAGAANPRQLMLSKLKCCSGLVHLDSGKFKAAAKCFLEVGPEIIGRYTEVISGSDIALYITLFSLATFDRAEIKSKILDNPVMKQFLELADPRLRDDVLHGFYNAKYGACLAALESLKPLFLLDMYLNPHIHNLYTMIRRKAIVQYIFPFSTVQLRKMSEAFGGNGSDASVSEMEEEVVGLISEGLVKARIDSHNKLLKINESDKRSNVFDHAVKTGQEYCKVSNFLQLRVQMMTQDMFVETPGGNGNGGGGGMSRAVAGLEREEGGENRREGGGGRAERTRRGNWDRMQRD